MLNYTPAHSDVVRAPVCGLCGLACLLLAPTMHGSSRHSPEPGEGVAAAVEAPARDSSSSMRARSEVSAPRERSVKMSCESEFPSIRR